MSSFTSKWVTVRLKTKCNTNNKECRICSREEKKRQDGCRQQRPPQRGNIGEKGQRLEDTKSSSGRQKKGQRKEENNKWTMTMNTMNMCLSQCSALCFFFSLIHFTSNFSSHSLPFTKSLTLNLSQPSSHLFSPSFLSLQWIFLQQKKPSFSCSIWK